MEEDTGTFTKVSFYKKDANTGELEWITDNVELLRLGFAPEVVAKLRDHARGMNDLVYIPLNEGTECADSSSGIAISPSPCAPSPIEARIESAASSADPCSFGPSVIP